MWLFSAISWPILIQFFLAVRYDNAENEFYDIMFSLQKKFSQ